MKEVRVCVVCGSKFVKVKRKASGPDVCSSKCRYKWKRRTDEGLPVNNIEFEKGKAERRKIALEKRIKKAEEAAEAAYICKREGCKYRADNTLHSCDYMLITGHRRGCPVEGCIRYEEGKRAVVQPM